MQSTAEHPHPQGQSSHPLHRSVRGCSRPSLRAKLADPPRLLLGRGLVSKEEQL